MSSHMMNTVTRHERVYVHTICTVIKESYTERATSLQPTRKQCILNFHCAFLNTLLFITIIFIRITSRNEPHKTVIEKKLRHQALQTVEHLRSDMFSVRLKNITAYPCVWKCRHHWRKNLNVSTWTSPPCFPRPQLPGCPLPVALQGPMARQSPAAGTAWWGQLCWCNDMMKD